MPYYISEQGNLPVQADPEMVLNRRQKRLASKAMKNEVSLQSTSEHFGQPALGNETLLIHEKKAEFIHLMHDNQVVIVVAETGVGKSTQVAQWVMEDGSDVVMTQPRRMAARNISSRISDEINAKWDDAGQDVAGYHTSEKSTITPNTRISVVTDGLRLAQDLNDHREVKSEVLIIDEVHEWNTNIEILVAIVKQQLVSRPDMRVVIMSATMDADGLSDYFAESTTTKPPVMNVLNRTFPIEKIIDFDRNPDQTVDSNVVDQTIKYAEDGQNVLMFMPGRREIDDAIDTLNRKLPRKIVETATILPLYSKQSDQDQQRVFQTYPGVKIIVATNVAQTSLTIGDIDVVVDSGFERRKEIDSKGVSSLVLNPISRADSTQRAGRAGRVKSGTYVLTRLDDDSPLMRFEDREEYPEPEILRNPLDEAILKLAAANIDLAQLDLFHTLDQQVVENNKQSLRVLGALNESGTITDIGLRMTEFTLTPSMARMMIEAEQFSANTQRYIAAITAVMDAGGLQYYAPKSERRWTELTDETESDMLAQLDIFMNIQNKDVTFMTEHDLDLKNIERARENYYRTLKKIDSDYKDLIPPNLIERENIKQCIYAGQIDFVYEYSGNKEYQRIGMDDDNLRELSNRSVVKGSPHMLVAKPYLVRTFKDGEMIDRHIVESATVLSDPSILGRIATNLCRWSEPENISWRGGRPVFVRRQQFKGNDIGITQEFEVVSSPEVREAIIAYAMDNPGPAQKELRRIKRELERLGHLSKEPIAQFTQHMLMDWINSAAPADITDPEMIDYTLRDRMRSSGFSLDIILPEEQRDQIVRSAPDAIDIEGYTFKVDYRNSKPLVKNVDMKIIATFSDEVHLEDGRQVWFVGEHGKHFDVRTIKSLVEQERFEIETTQ